MLRLLANTGISIINVIPLGVLIPRGEDEGAGILQPGEEMVAERPWYLQSGQQRDEARSFTMMCGRKTRSGGLKLKKGRFREAIKEKKKITGKVTMTWKFSRPNHIKPQQPGVSVCLTLPWTGGSIRDLLRSLPD